MTQRRLILWIALAVLLIAGVVAAIIFLTRPSTPSQPQIPAPTTNASVKVSNLSSGAPDLNVSLRSEAESSLNQFIQAMHPKSDTTGSIRNGSYKVTTNDSGKNITFLVDFAALKITYKVDIGLSDSEHILYIVCPTQDELIYPAFECKDSFSV